MVSAMISKVRVFSLGLALLALGLTLGYRPANAQANNPTVTAPPQSVACPAFLPAEVACFQGRSDAGALYVIAKPKEWNGTFILFAHGGPRLGTPKLEETVEDLEKFQVLVREGYAWAGTTYRRGGYGVRSAAADMEDLRQIVWSHFGRPQLTLLHGQSWGGNVAAKAAELYALNLDGERVYDGVILTSAVLAGGTKSYQLRTDLRAVYQYYCNNHPRPDEQGYPLWQGLPAGATMTRGELSRRVQDCTGIGLPASQRTPQQRSNARNITAVLRLQEDQLVPNLAWATTTFQDLVARLGGRNPFSNAQSRYRGATNDRALNAGVARFDADPTALAQLAYDSDLSGMIVLPTITVHGLYDPVARVCHQSAYRETVEGVGRGHLLVQTLTAETEHSRLAPPAYPAITNALSDWIKSGNKPTQSQIQASCQAIGARLEEPCHMVLRPQAPKWPC